MKLSGHSQASNNKPIIRLMIWSTGIGRTAGSRVLVRKSQRILGQKKAWTAAVTWSVFVMLVSCLLILTFGCCCNLQAADERTTSLAQWFLISLPMVIDSEGF